MIRAGDLWPEPVAVEASRAPFWWGPMVTRVARGVSAANGSGRQGRDPGSSSPPARVAPRLSPGARS